MRARLSWVVPSAIGVLLCGCTGRAPTKADIVGTWVRENGGEVVFLPDGRFVARNVPAENLLSFEANPHGPPRIDAAGAWRLTAPEGKVELGTYEWEIAISLGPVPGHVPVGAGLTPRYQKVLGPAYISLDGDEDKATFYEKAPRAAHLSVP